MFSFLQVFQQPFIELLYNSKNNILNKKIKVKINLNIGLNIKINVIFVLIPNIHLIKKQL